MSWSVGAMKKRDAPEGSVPRGGMGPRVVCGAPEGLVVSQYPQV